MNENLASPRRPDAVLPERPAPQSAARPLTQLMKSAPATVTTPGVRRPNASELALLERITERAFAQTQAMIHIANTRKDKRPGDPKVGGHPASCASSMHILAALHLWVREPEDYVCCKPHASPVDHSLHHLMQLFR